jgi:hypothetical protein
MTFSTNPGRLLVRRLPTAQNSNASQTIQLFTRCRNHESVPDHGTYQESLRLLWKGTMMQEQDVAGVLRDPMAQELMQSSIPARLAYVGPDGFPRAIPIGFHWNGAEFVLCTVPHAPKVSALKANPKVAFTVDTNTFPPHVLLVRGIAAIDLVDGVPAEYLAASRKGVGPDQWDAFEAQVRAMYKQMARIKIKPLWAKLLDFQTRFPSPIEKLIRQTS